MNGYHALEVLRREAEHLESRITQRREIYADDVLRLESEQAAIQLLVLRLDDILIAIEKLEGGEIDQ